LALSVWPLYTMYVLYVYNYPYNLKNSSIVYNQRLVFTLTIYLLGPQHMNKFHNILYGSVSTPFYNGNPQIYHLLVMQPTPTTKKCDCIVWLSPQGGMLSNYHYGFRDSGAPSCELALIGWLSLGLQVGGLATLFGWRRMKKRKSHYTQVICGSPEGVRPLARSRLR